MRRTGVRNVADVRAAVVGPGTIGRIHAEAIRRAGARVRVVVGRTDAGAKAARDQIGAETATADFSLVLADPEIDVVHICTPNVFHYPMALEALAAGKHVMLEKPLAITETEARELARTAAAAGGVHAVCFNMRFYPLIQELRERVRRGDLGEIVAVRASVLEDGLLEATDWNWRLDPSVGGPSVALSTIGCHLIDLVTFVVGNAITEVCADLRTVHPRRRADGPEGPETNVDAQEIAHLLVRFRGGCRGILGISQASAGRRYDYAVEVDGSRQAAAWRAPDGNALWVGSRHVPNQIVLRDPALLTGSARGYVGYGAAFPEGFADTFKQLVTHMYDAIVAGNPSDQAEAAYPTFHDGLAAVSVHGAVLRSGSTGRWESVEYSSA